MPWVAWWITFAGVLAVALLTGGDDGSGDPGARPAAPVADVARRVERIRELRFDALPRPQTVTAEQARREGLEALDRDYPPEARRADEDVLELLGLVAADTDLRAVAEQVFEGQVAGYYDPATRRLRIVSGPSSDGPYGEIVVAHELVHALEDQRFDLRLDDLSGVDDRTLAYGALVEGTATALMFEYAERHLTGGEVLSGLLAEAVAPPPQLPGFLQAQLAFPYTAGQRFVERLFELGGGWTLIDLAHRRRPPASTEQVLHPEAYLAAEAPRRVRAPRLPGRGWERAGAGVLGEFQTAEVLRSGGGLGATAAAEGWGGDRYALWRGPRGRALAVRWTWDTARDQREFARRLRAYVASGAPGAAAAVGVTDGAVTLAVADDRAVARALARRGRPATTLARTGR